MLSGIKHIEFWVSDLARSMAFYRRLFALIGWEEFDATSFLQGDTKIYFVEKAVRISETLGPRHICFLAGSREVVDGVGDFLKISGAEIIRGPIESRYKGRISYTVDFKDCNGYILEVATASMPQ